MTDWPSPTFERSGSRRGATIGVAITAARRGAGGTALVRFSDSALGSAARGVSADGLVGAMGVGLVSLHRRRLVAGPRLSLLS